MAQKDQLLHMKNKEDEAEKSAFERFEQELKQTISGVLFLMLKDEETTFWKVTIIMVVCEIEILVLPFNDDINYPWKNGDFAIYFKGFFKLFLISYWCSLLTWAAYLIIFYVGVFLLAMTVAIMGYAAYLFSHKQFTVMWPFHILRAVCSLSITVLFYPFIGTPLALTALDLYSSMFKCEDGTDGVSRHYAFAGTTCWKDLHILHGVAGIVAFVLFVVICLVVVLCFFETKISSSDPSARANARNDFWSMLFKTLCNLLSALLLGDDYRWVNIVVLIIGGVVLHIKQRADRPYYNDLVNVVADINNGVFLWATAMLVVVMLLEKENFDGGLQIFLMGLPLVILLMLTGSDPRRDMLLKNIDDYDNGELWYNKVRYYISFIQRKEMSRDVSVQLKGYIYNHEEKCSLPNCPLKVYINNITSIIKDKKKKQSKAAAENFVLLMRFANLLFLQGIAKFPSCTSLRIAYSFFLKERMGNRSLAINELLAAEKGHPPFDEQFVIYRYRKMIEDEMADVQADNQGGQLDAISAIAYDNYLRQFKEAIERTALLHMEFWLEVLEPEPDLGKLDKTGSKIHGAIVQVEDYWAKLIKVNSNAPKALKIYADFLIEILNDAEAGGELLSRAKETAIARQNYNPNSLDATELMGMGDMCAAMGGADGTPCMVASGEQGKLGEILQFNMAVCRIFGYTKAELSGRKISSLMPDMYARVHDKILQRCINSNEDTTTAGAKDIFILARHKSGYLMPLFLQARMMSSVTHGTLFVATMKLEKKGLSVCYLLLNEQQDVVAVSSRCISTLKLTSRLLKNSRVSFQTLAPSTQDKNVMSQYSASKSGGLLDFFLPDATLEEDNEQQSASHLQKSEIISESVQHVESPAKKLRVKASKDVLHLTCVISEIVLMGEVSGYVVRLEPADEGKDFAFASKVEKLPKYPNVQFAFDPIEMKYIQQDCLDDAQKRIADETSAYVNIMRDRSHSSASPAKSDDTTQQNRLDTSMISSVIAPVDDVTRMQQSLLKRKAYGDGIKTKRLVDGDEVYIEGVKCRLIEKQLEEDQEQEDAKRHEGKSEDKKDDIFQNSLKSKKAFNAALNEKSVPSSINKLKKTGYIIVLAIVALASTEFGLILTEFNDIGDNINMVKYSRMRISIQMKLAFYINKMVLMVRTANPRVTENASAYLTLAKSNISTALNEYYDVQNKITLSTLSLSSENSKLYTDKCVNLYYKNSSQQQSTIKTYTLTEAIQQLASEAFTIQSFSSNANYAVGNDDIDFVLYNAFADLYTKMARSADLFVKELKDRGTNKQVIVYVLYAVALLVSVLSVTFLFPVVASVSCTRLDVLSLFFDIPQNSVKVLEKKCEKFVARSNDENVDDIMSSEGEMLVGNNGMVIDAAAETPDNNRTGRHKRKFKNNTTTNTTFYLQFLFAILIVAAYFSYNFAYGYLFLKNIAKYARELNATTGIQAETAASFSIYQNLIGNRRLLMYTEDQTFSYLASQEISNMYGIASEVQNSHNDYQQSFTGDYQDTFIGVMRSSLCDYGSQFNFTFGTCSTFLDGTLAEGLHPVIVQYIEQLREQLTAYKSAIASSTNQTIVNATMTSSFLNTIAMKNMETTIFQVIDVAMRYLVDSLVSSYTSQHDTEVTKRIILFICFIIIFLIAFLALWTPFVNKLNEEVTCVLIYIV